jgi:hypothetical protein
MTDQIATHAVNGLTVIRLCLLGLAAQFVVNASGGTQSAQGAGSVASATKG